MKRKETRFIYNNFLDFSAVFLIVKIVIPETGVLGMVNEGSNAVYFSVSEEAVCGRSFIKGRQ